MRADRLVQLQKVLALGDALDAKISIDHESLRELLAIAEAAEDLRADAMRLDWLEAHAMVEVDGDCFLKVPLPTWAVKDVRTAIDAALSTVAPVREGT